MSSSPYEGLVNAQIVFSVPDGAAPVNAAGNAKIVHVDITVRAYLKFDSKAAKKNIPDRFPEWAQSYSGYAVEPMRLPSSITPLTRGTATIGSEEGEFILEGTLLNPPYGRDGIGAIAEGVTGTKFSGWFVPKTYGV